jgi:hypothetical protein
VFTKVESPAGPAVVRLRAHIGGPGSCKVYWLSTGEPPTAASNSSTFEARRDTWHEYTVEFKAGAPIAGLRLELGVRGVVEIDQIELSSGQLLPADIDPSELAAWTTLARVLLNLDSTITRE